MSLYGKFPALLGEISVVNSEIPRRRGPSTYVDTPSSPTKRAGPPPCKYPLKQYLLNSIIYYYLYFVYCTFYNKDYFQVIFCNIKIMPYLRLQTVEIVCKNKALLHDVISIVKIMLLNVAVFIVV